jgi:hypothetical protein
MKYDRVMSQQMKVEKGKESGKDIANHCRG